MVPMVSYGNAEQNGGGLPLVYGTRHPKSAILEEVSDRSMSGVAMSP